jgi:hypothetical protein
MADGLLNNVGATSIEDPVTISQEGQDVAKATGVAYQDIGKAPEAQYADYDATKTGETLQDNVGFQPGTS